MEGKVKPRKIKKNNKSEEVVSKKSNESEEVVSKKANKAIFEEKKEDSLVHEQKVVHKRKRKLYLKDIDTTDEESMVDDLIQEEIMDHNLQNDDNFSIGLIVFILAMSLAVGIVMGYVLYRIAMGL